MLYKDSNDPKVAQAGVEVKSGRKWRADKAVLQAKSQIHHKALVGTVMQGRAGLGTFRTPQYDKARGEERRRLVQEEVKVAVEEERTSRAVGLRQQGAWTRWEQAMDRKVTLTDLRRAVPQRIKVLVQAVYHVLPSHSNLFTWGKVEYPACPQCSGRGTLEPILSSCPVALCQGLAL